MLSCNAVTGAIPQEPSATATIQATTTSTANPVKTSTPAVTPTLGLRGMWRSSRLAYASNRTGRYQVYLMRPDGSSVTQLTDSAGDNRSPVWSPDAKHIFFVSARDGNSEIYVMDPDGTNQRNISNNPQADWMPLSLPGEKLAFISNRKGRDRVFVMGADGSNVKDFPLTSIDSTSNMICLTWYEEGEFFFTTEENGQRTTHMLDTSNGDTWIPEPLAGQPDRSCPSLPWTSNSTWTMFITNRDGHDEIYGFVDSQDPDEQFTKGTEASLGISRSADGGWITFYTRRNGNGDIYIMYLRNKENWNITDNPSDDVDPAWEPY